MFGPARPGGGAGLLITPRVRWPDDRRGASLLHPARRGEPEPVAARVFKPLPQTIESVNHPLKGHLDLEGHGSRTTAGVVARILQRLLAP